MNLSSSDDDDDGSSSGYSSNDEDIAEILDNSKVKVKVGLEKKKDVDTHKNTTTNTTVSGRQGGNSDADSDSDSDGFSNVDWEDASVEDDDDEEDEGHGQGQEQGPSSANGAFIDQDQETGRAYPTKDVVIHFNESRKNASVTIDSGPFPLPLPHSAADANTDNSWKKYSKKEKKTKRKNKRMKKVQNHLIAPSVKKLLEELQRAHILSSISRSIFHSSVFGSMSGDGSDNRDGDDEEMELLWSLAHSLVPLEFLQEDIDDDVGNGNGKVNIIVPTYSQVHEFSSWFFQLVNHIERRRWRIRRSNAAAGAGAPRRRRPRRAAAAVTSTRVESTTTTTSKRGAKKSNSCGNTWKNGIHTQHGTSSNEELTVSGNIRRRLIRLFSFISPSNDYHPEHVTMEKEEDVGYITTLEKVLLFTCMTRSLGWRTRFVKALIPIEKELTVDHPIFESTMKNTFHSIMKNISKKHTRGSSTRKKGDGDASASAPSKKKKGRNKRKLEKVNEEKKNSNSAQIGTSSPSSSLANTTIDDFVWVEVLCQKNSSTSEPLSTLLSSSSSSPKVSNKIKSLSQSKNAKRWIHIDPHYELFDKPSLVECIDSSNSNSGMPRKTPIKNKIRRPVSYVVAVEHSHDLPAPIPVPVPTHAHIFQNGLHPVFFTGRLTDITPRYANKWSYTLKLRGATAKEISKGKCSNTWWAGTVKATNRYLVKQRRKYGLSQVCNDKEQKKKKSQKSCGESTRSSPFKVEKHQSGEDVLVLDDSSEEEKRSSAIILNETSEDDSEDLEEQEFANTKEREAIPTSKAAFKNHPLYVIPSVLKNQEVLCPNAKKRMCGMFKGELVYKRSDASTALTAKKWLYDGRKVKQGELSKPAKIVKARKKPVPKGFQALESYGATTSDQADGLNLHDKDEDEGKNKLYGVWQTKKWSPPRVGPNDRIPVNEFRNVELALLNPGLIHLELRRIAQVAKRLGVPYAPCLLGFEGHGGDRTPTIRGIVVHKHNVDLLQEAHLEFESQAVENEYKERQRAIYGRWQRLIVGMMTKDRLEREYVND